MRILKRLALGLAGLCAATAANAAITTFTWDGVIDFSDYSLPDTPPSSFRIVASFDSALLPAGEGFHGAVGSLLVYVDGAASPAWNCSTASGCAGYSNNSSSTSTDYEYAPGQFITLNHTITNVTSTTIGVWRNADGSFDISRSGASALWSTDECQDSVFAGTLCHGSSHAVGVQGSDISDEIHSYAPYSTDWAVAYGHVTSNSVTSVVPEPDALAAMLGGLSLIGWSLRRRRG
ncbi:PEP-CTERM sorting domain-containing protein [Derxia gummosa]|uniref:PEP-CTERM sorting domain-containing protein n=1 Tax=Derxia gummosa DSM 723 TaxID=1121388 RepID=A0A8B6X370_9BURK|nr:PEP-CTERM sorting domain-containing protein [Derxia gummosa]